MTQAISIHVGVNRPHGRPYEARLVHSEASAVRMAQLAREAGFEAILVLCGQWATRKAVAVALQRAAGLLGPDDYLLVTFSGHGCEQPDTDVGALRDRGGQDQGWCLHDGTLLDDQLLRCWQQFRPGVRIVVVSESCYSGGMGRDEPLDFCRAVGATIPRPDPASRDGGSGSRDGGMGFHDGTPVHGGGETGYRDGAIAYRGGSLGAPCITKARDNDGIQATVLLLAACQAHQKARDGLFACHLLTLWDGGAFQGSYCDLYHQLRERVRADKPDQEPHIVMLGSGDPRFSLEQAFRVDHVVYRGQGPSRSAAS